MMSLALASCTTTKFDSKAEKIEITNPVKIDLAMPSTPAYPQGMVWEKAGDKFSLQTSDMDRLIKWMVSLKKWKEESLPTWLGYYGLSVGGLLENSTQ